MTGATFSYVDAMLTGRMSEVDLARIREDILGSSGPAQPPDPLVHVEALMGARDYAGALAECERLLEHDRSLAKAARLAEECRTRLADLYQARVGGGDDVPRLAVAPEHLGSYGVDRWEAYLISRFHPQASLDKLIETAGLSRLDTLRLLYELMQKGIVVMERRVPAGPPSAPGSGGAVLARVKLKRG